METAAMTSRFQTFRVTGNSLRLADAMLYWQNGHDLPIEPGEYRLVPLLDDRKCAVGFELLKNGLAQGEQYDVSGVSSQKLLEINPLIYRQFLLFDKLLYERSNAALKIKFECMLSEAILDMRYGEENPSETVVYPYFRVYGQQLTIYLLRSASAEVIGLRFQSCLEQVSMPMPRVFMQTDPLKRLAQLFKLKWSTVLVGWRGTGNDEFFGQSLTENSFYSPSVSWNELLWFCEQQFAQETTSCQEHLILQLIDAEANNLSFQDVESILSKLAVLAGERMDCQLEIRKWHVVLAEFLNTYISPDSPAREDAMDGLWKLWKYYFNDAKVPEVVFEFITNYSWFTDHQEFPETQIRENYQAISQMISYWIFQEIQAIRTLEAGD